MALNGKQKDVFQHCIIEPSEWYGIIDINENISKKIEFYYGNGYLSQNSRHLIINDEIHSVKVYDFKGGSREIAK
jgi:hypothetical protein